MRNLKKILALVLALIMSLSLMATASATDFKDDANVGETYRVAVDVLSDLSVFGGDQNGNFNPADPIRRSEVAAIIYRIATGDTGSEGHKSYTPYNQFADVVDGSWYAGYVTYCANAGYIKGRNDGNFHPNDNVTGYEVLAMILRAVGYDKNNEFVGSNWQTNTASIATQRGVLKNLTGTTLLSQPATREVVAELLFRSIMLQQVTWNANSLSYSDNGATLAKQSLNMEAVTGVVMGNERGNLEGTSVLAEGKTSLNVDGKSYTLNISTDLTVIGESRSAYIQNGTKVLGGLLEDAGNDVKDNEGAETTVEKLRGGLVVKDAQHFKNFADEDQDSSEWLVRYVVNAESLTSAWVEYFDDLSHKTTDAHHVVKLNAAGATVEWDSTDFVAYEVSIQPETEIPATDKAIMKAIFYTANRNEANPIEKPVEGYVYGEVYVGTSSLEDKSDIMSWNKFVETYLVTGKVQPITKVGNGNWLKIIDNNGDGKAEYVLHTIYTLDEVADSATRNGATTYFYNGIDSTAYTPIYLDGYTPAVGDIVLYAVIDGTYQIHKADTAKATFKAVNYKDRQATDVNGDVKEESDIINETRLPQTLTNVNENVEYDLYLDDYGYVRAYNNKTSYALVTEMYTTNKLNQGWVTGRALTAEVAIAGENAIREYPVLNSSYYNNNNQNYNPFYTAEARYPIQNWNWVVNEAEWVQGEPNYLKPATHMLDMGQKQGNEFHFADSKFDGPSDNRTWTNVAEYIMGDNGINLYTAAKGNDNSQNPHTDYIQLAIRDTSAANPLYVINDVNYPKDTGDVNAQDNYVRAVDNTQFFAVDQYGSVRQWVGYRNTLKLEAEKNDIHAMYAVATDTNANRDNKPYWVANVIVIEVREFTESFESISLIYSNNTKISGDVKYLQALDNAKGEIGIIPNNIDIWNGQFTDYGFYGLTNIKVYDEENKLYTADVTSIHSSYGTNHTTALKDCEDYKIFYGVVRSRLDENYYSDYITADVIDINGNVVKESVTLSLADFGGAYRIIQGANNYLNRYNEAVWMTLGGHASNRVNEGDRILWVEVPGNSTNKVGFIVDINDKYVPGSLHTWENAAFIETLRSKIALEQTTTPVDPVEAAKTAAVNALNAAAEAAKAGLDKDAPDYDAKVAAINAALEAALTKVNEADTAENVAAAKAEGLEAIEAAAKGEEPQPPQDEYDLTLTIGEHITKVTVTITVEGQEEPDVRDYTESTTEPIKVPAGAKVEFAVEYENGYGELESAAPIEKMEADQTAEFTAAEKAPVTTVTVNPEMYFDNNGATEPFKGEDGQIVKLNQITDKTPDAEGNIELIASEFKSPDFTFTVLRVEADTTVTGTAPKWTVAVGGDTMTIKVVIDINSLVGKEEGGEGDVDWNEGQEGIGDVGIIEWPQNHRARAAVGDVLGIYADVQKGYEIKTAIFARCEKVETEGDNPIITKNADGTTRYLYGVKMTADGKPQVFFSTAKTTAKVLTLVNAADDMATASVAKVSVKDGEADTAKVVITAKLGKKLTEACVEELNKFGVLSEKDDSNKYTLTIDPTKITADATVTLAVEDDETPIKVNLTLTFTEVNTVKVGTKSLTTAEAKEVDSVGGFVTVTGKLISGTAKGSYVVAEPKTGSKGEIWGTVAEADGTFEIKLPVSGTTASFDLYTTNGELQVKKNFHGKDGIELTDTDTSIVGGTIAGGEVTMDLSSKVTRPAPWTSLASLLFTGAGEAVEVGTLRDVDGNETTQNTNINLELVKAFDLKLANGKTILVKILTQTAAPIYIVDENGTALGNGYKGDVITITGLEGKYFEMANKGTQQYKLGGADGAELVTGTGTSSVNVADFMSVPESGTIKFKIPSAFASNTLTITDNYYKVSPVTAPSTAGTVAYIQAGEPIAIAAGTAYTYFCVTGVDTEGKTVYYGADGKTAAEGTFIQNVKTGTDAGKASTAVMPEADVTLTHGYWKVVYKCDITPAVEFKTVFGAADSANWVKGAAADEWFVLNDNSITTAAGQNLKIHAIDKANQADVVIAESKNDGKITYNSEATLVAKDAAVTVKTTVGGTAGQAIALDVVDGKVTFDSVIDTLGLKDNEYVTILQTTSTYAEIDANGELVAKRGGDAAKPAFIKVSALRGTKMASTLIVADTEISTGYVKLTFSIDGMTDEEISAATGTKVNFTNGTVAGATGTDWAISGYTEAVDCYIIAGKTVTFTIATGERYNLTIDGTPVDGILGDGAKLTYFVDGNTEWVLSPYTVD